MGGQVVVRSSLWSCGRRTVELLEDLLLLVVVQLVGVERRQLRERIPGAGVERRLADLVECLGRGVGLAVG